MFLGCEFLKQCIWICPLCSWDVGREECGGGVSDAEAGVGVGLEGGSETFFKVDMARYSCVYYTPEMVTGIWSR